MTISHPRVGRIVPHLCGLPTRLRRSRLLFMLSLRTFIDESGTEEPAPRDVFMMGGWLANVETWERFSDDWHKELGKSPAIAYFKHWEAKSLSDQFAGWSGTDA